jgi:hypothetical protein
LDSLGVLQDENCDPLPTHYDSGVSNEEAKSAQNKSKSQAQIDLSDALKEKYRSPFKWGPHLDHVAEMIRR